MKKLSKIALCLAVMTCTVAKADLYDVPKVTTVQNRLYFLNNEITLQGSYLPLDPFVKYYGVGLSYTKHFSSFTSWEIFNANYVLAQPAGLKKSLNALGKTESTADNIIPFDDVFFTMKYFASTNLKFTPFYTKNLFFNSKIVYSMFSFVGGAGIASFERDDKKETRMRPFINVGVILHYMISDATLIKFDFRDQVFTASDTKNNLTLTLGLAFNIGGGSEKEEREIEEEF